MPTTEERIRKLISDNLEVDGQPIDPAMPLDTKMSDTGISSTDLVAFAKVLQDEFGIQFSIEDCSPDPTLGGLVSAVNAKTA